MARKPIYHKDGDLTSEMTITAGATTEQDTSFDLNDQDSSLLDLAVVFVLSNWAGLGDIVFNLIGDDDSDLSSPTVIASITVSGAGEYEIAIPQNFAFRYAGLQAVTPGGEGADVDELFLNVPLDNR